VVVAMVVATWAVLWAARGHLKGQKAPRPPKRTCPRCHSRETGAGLLTEKGEKTIGTCMHCWGCGLSFDFKYWEPK